MSSNPDKGAALFRELECLSHDDQEGFLRLLAPRLGPEGFFWLVAQLGEEEQNSFELGLAEKLYPIIPNKAGRRSG